MNVAFVRLKGEWLGIGGRFSIVREGGGVAFSCQHPFSFLYFSEAGEKFDYWRRGYERSEG